MQESHMLQWKFYNKVQNLTKAWDLRDKESLEGTLDGSEGRWNNKCAIERSMGFVSVSISINPVHLIEAINASEPKKKKR